MAEKRETERIFDLFNSLSREEQMNVLGILWKHEREREKNGMYALKCDRCKRDIAISAKADEVRYCDERKYVYNIEGVEYVLCDTCNRLYKARVRNFFLEFLDEEAEKECLS